MLKFIAYLESIYNAKLTWYELEKLENLVEVSTWHFLFKTIYTHYDAYDWSAFVS